LRCWRPCAPGVAPDTTVSIAKVESGPHALAVHDSTSGTRYGPVTPGATIATDLVVAHDHNVDLGVMQVNSTNLAAIGLSIADAFNACQSMRTGSEIPSRAYHHALRATLYTYNVGDPIRGITDGYVAGGEAIAPAVPSIVAFAPAGPARASPTHDATASARTWNIFIERSVIAGAVRWYAESPE
jgi:type IV secretion system protein VirB1